MKKISRTEKDAIMTALQEKYNKWYNPDVNFDIYELDGTWAFREDHRLVLGINWAAIGTVSPGDTVKFAKSLIAVSKVVDRINSLGLAVDPDLEDHLETKEQFDAAVKEFKRKYLG